MATARVRVLTAGGTIAQKFDASKVARMVGVSELASIAKVQGVDVEYRPVFQKSSSEILPEDWISLAKAAEVSLREKLDGVVILHGTDTMQYTAAALSFMLRGLSVPVVLTGSMIPGNETNSDSHSNLIAAIRVAAFADLAEVCVVFSADGKKDGTKTIIRGTRVKKVRSTAINAFDSVNVPPLGMLKRAKISISTRQVERRKRNLSVRATLERQVCLVKLSPSLTSAQLDSILKGTKGAVVEGMGVGHIRGDLLKVIANYGKPTVITTQCLYGGEHLGMYDHDANVLSIPNVIAGHDMLPEVALVKLMWVLPQAEEIKDVRHLMQQDLSGELAGFSVE